MSIWRGTTPDITMTFPTGSVDFTDAQEILVTLKDPKGNMLLEAVPTATAEELTVFLTQEQTLSLPVGTAYLQANWTYLEDGILKRACSQIYSVGISANLHNEVM